MQEPNKTQHIPDKTRDFYMIPAIFEDSISAIRGAAESILDEIIPIETAMAKARENAWVEDGMCYLYGDRENPATT